MDRVILLVSKINTLILIWENVSIVTVTVLHVKKVESVLHALMDSFLIKINASKKTNVHKGG